MTQSRRQTVVAWWLFHKTDSEYPPPCPESLLEWIEEAESDLEGCDAELSRLYQEYVPQ